MMFPISRRQILRQNPSGPPHDRAGPDGVPPTAPVGRVPPTVPVGREPPTANGGPIALEKGMSQFEWSDLRIFLAVSRGRSVRSGAKLLGVSHSTVSRRLVAMENALGARLFERRPEGYFLTAAGENILPGAERIETEIIGMQTEVFGQDARLSGPVRISMPPILAQRLVMPHLKRFADLYPEIELEIISSYTLSDMSRRNADIAVRFQDSPDPFLFGRRLPEFADSIYAHPDYVADHRFTGENATAKWLGWGDGLDLPAWVKDTPFPTLRVGHECPDPLAQVEAAKAGLGVAILPCFVGDATPELMRVPDAGVYKSRQGWVLTHPDLKTTERVRTCVRFLVDAIQGHAELVTGAQCAPHPG